MESASKKTNFHRSASKKRRLPHASAAEREIPEAAPDRRKCWFCGAANAAVVLKSLTDKPLCLLHYYTTRAVREDSSKVKPAGDGSEIELQLESGVQDLFAEAFTDLKKEIAEQSARAFRATASDPLAAINDARRKPKAKPKRPHPSAESDEGGFMRKVPLPERFARNQKRQKELEASRLNGTSKPASISRTDANPYKRRKPAKASYWNLALDHDEKGSARIQSDWEKVEKQTRPAITCDCGSTEVSSDGTVTGRNNDMGKGETWGHKDRCEVVTRCRCLKCGKTWNEED